MEIEKIQVITQHFTVLNRIYNGTHCPADVVKKQKNKKKNCSEWNAPIDSRKTSQFPCELDDLGHLGLGDDIYSKGWCNVI